MREASIDIPGSVHFAEIDFKKDVLPNVLSNAGHKPSEKTFYIWEGVSMYLSESAVRNTLRAISGNSASGSSIVMDFAGRAMIEMLHKLPQLPQLPREFLTRAAYPWRLC